MLCEMDRNLLRRLKLKQSGMREGGELLLSLPLHAMADTVRASTRLTDEEIQQCMGPGLEGMSVADVRQVIMRLRRLAAISESMTPAERADPTIIGHSEILRIAAGSGNTVETVADLLRTFNPPRQASGNPLQGCSWSWLVDSRWSERLTSDPKDVAETENS